MPAFAPFAHHQPMPIEDRMHGADGRELDVAMQASDLLADLRGSPARVFTLELHDELLDLERQTVRMPVGAARPIGQTV